MRGSSVHPVWAECVLPWEGELRRRRRVRGALGAMAGALADTGIGPAPVGDSQERKTRMDAKYLALRLVERCETYAQEHSIEAVRYPEQGWSRTCST